MALTRHRLVAEITIVVDAIGTEQTFLFATSGFTTLPTDTPANTTVSARLHNPGNVSRELFSGARVAGGVRPSFGVVELLNSDGALDAWLQYGTSNGRVVLRWGAEGAAYPSAYTLVYRALIYSLSADFDAVRLVLRDRSHLLDNPFVSATFTGAGAREGYVPAGRRKHLVLGEPGLTPVQLLDATRGIVYVQANAADSRVHRGLAPYALYDGGNKLIHQAAKSTWSAFVADAPATGYYTTYVGDADSAATSGDTTGPVFYRYGGTPVGELRARSAGYLLNSSNDTLRPWRFSDLLARAGIDTALAAGSTNFALGSRWLGGSDTYAAVANDCARALQVAWGFTQNDAPFAFALKDPADTTDAADTVQFTFTKHNSRGFRRVPIQGMEAPVWQVVCNAGEVWPTVVNNSATAETRAEMTRQWPYVSFSASAEAVRTAHPGAISDEVVLVGRYFTTRDEQQAFGDRYLTLYGGRRDLVELVCVQFDAETLAIELHDKVQLLLDRFACSPARTFRVIGITQDLQRREIAFRLWGGEAGPVSGGIGGGVVVGDGPLTPGVPPGGSGSSAPPPVEGSSGGTSESAAVGAGVLPPCGHQFTISVGGAGGVGVGVATNGAQTLPACGHVFNMLNNSPANDPYRAYRLLVLHGDGANGSAPIDSSPNPITLAAYDGAAVDTSTAKFGTGSIVFDGVNDWLEDNNETFGAAWQLQSTWELELQYKPTATPPLGTGSTSLQMLYCRRKFSDAQRVFLAYGYFSGVQTNPGLWFQINRTSGGGGGVSLIRDVTLSTSVFTHIRLAYDGAAYYLFVDGVLQGAALASSVKHPDLDDLGNLHIGYGWASSFWAHGRVDEYFLTAGHAVTTDNFTPPTAALPDS